ELAVHLLVEARIDVDAFVRRAVERPHRRRGRAAARRGAALVEDERRLAEGDAGFGEQRLPRAVEVVERVARLGGLGVLRAQRLLVLRSLELRRRALLRALHRAEHLRRVEPEYHRADQRDRDRAAADLPAAAAGEAATAAADVDVAGVERIEPHRASLCCACEIGLDRRRGALDYLSLGNGKEAGMFLAGKRALVTGSTSGIGLAIARALAAEGAEVVLNGFGDAGEIERLCRELGAR